MTKHFEAELNFPKFRFTEPDRRTTRVCATRQINQTVEKLEEEAIDSRRGIKNKWNSIPAPAMGG